MDKEQNSNGLEEDVKRPVASAEEQKERPAEGKELHAAQGE